jgi:hypothetical protein
VTDVEKKELPNVPDGLEHLARLADDRWREYESKSQAEWKLSYSVWATLLAATASILTQSENIPVSRPVMVFAVISFAVLAFFVHKQFP